MHVSTPAEDALRAAADIFHKIVSDHGAREILDREGHKMPQLMVDSMTSKLLDPAEVDRLAADGFEICVRALAALGATDVSIHECKASDLEIW